MTDIDEIFKASIDLEGHDAGAGDDIDGASVRPIDLRDDMFDVARLVAQWNEEHDPSEQDDPAASRFAGARGVIADHIGSHPAETVEPPEPIAEPEAMTEVGGVQKLSRRDRRRAQREIDRLQREIANTPAGDAGPGSDDVALLPTSAEFVASAAAEPAAKDPTGPRTPLPAPPVVPPAADVADTAGTAPVTDEAMTPTTAGSEPDTEPVEVVGTVRFPILTRSVLVWLLIFLAAGIAFGASAVFWWAHFNSEVDAIRTETSSFTDQVETAAGAIESQRTDALTEINSALDDLSRLTGATTAVIDAGDHADSVWAVTTLDPDGVASVGTAFAVANEQDRSLLLTALDPVRAATAEPGPDIVLRNGDRELPADIWSWDEGRDLALLVVDDPGLPVLVWAGEDEAAQALGSGIYALGGLGAEGAAASPGLVLDQSTVGIQHTAPIGTAYRGGPIMTGGGNVLAVASTTYRPLGFDPGAVPFAVPISAACDSLLTCTIEDAPVAGAEGGPELAGTDGSPGGDQEAPTESEGDPGDGGTSPAETE